MKNKNYFLPVVTLLFLSVSTHAENSPEPPKSSSKTVDLAELRAMAQNPLMPTYSLPLKYVYHGDANRGGVSVGTIQPIFPIALGKDWNLINQFSLNFIGTPGGVTGIENLPSPYIRPGRSEARGARGLADTNLTSLFSPVQHGNFFWGIGSTVTFPSDAPRRELGSGKFIFGPAAAFVFQNQSWTVGLQASQQWSVFGSQARRSVSQMVLKPLVSYNLADGWYLLSNTTIVANWEQPSDQQWTVPVGGGFGKTFVLGDYKMNARLEGYYNVDRPDQAPDWSLGSTLQLLFPE